MRTLSSDALRGSRPNGTDPGPEDAAWPAAASAEVLPGPSRKTPRLRLESAGRRYGDRIALHPVSLQVDPGAIVVVEGANGSGKSTLLRLAAGLLRPTTGGRWCSGSALYLRPDGGGRLVETVRQALHFAAVNADGSAEAAGSAGDLQLRIEEGLRAADLTGLADRRIGSLSSGERSRLTAAVLLAVRPAVACLDEPTVHLDDAGSAAVAAAVRATAARGGAVLVAVHDRRVFEGAYDARIRMSRGHASLVGPGDRNGEPPDG